MPTVMLALRSLWNRRGTAALTAISIAISVALLLGVQLTRGSLRDSFTNTLSGTDLVVGARTAPLDLVLQSVFRIGEANAEVSWKTYQRIARHPDVAWTVPLSLGDSHRGFRVLGTSRDYFVHYRYAHGQPLRFAAGLPFRDLYDVVLGAEVARTLGYRLGDSIVVSHGVGAVSFAPHADQPFRVTGILAPTGTPVDRTLHVGLEAITAIHLDWRGGAEVAAELRTTAERARQRDLTPEGVTAFLVGMRSRVLALTMQRAINQYRDEALSAAIPGVALEQLWSIVGVAESALSLVAAFVVLAGLLGMVTAMLTSLNERRREMAILRSVGAAPHQVFALLVLESGALALAGTVAGSMLAYGLLLGLGPWVQSRLGLALRPGWPARTEITVIAAVLAAALMLSMVPAWRAYRSTLNDGLQART
jgi:putative ABC transport system permease protein